MLSSSIKALCRLPLRNGYYFSSTIKELRRQKEANLAQKIKAACNASYVSVTDTTVGSSSCGQMYNILV